MFREFTEAQIGAIVSAASAAPSLHNSQPWQFSVEGDVLQLSGVAERALWVADPSARALYISCGAALLNARVAIRMTGCEPTVRLLPHPEYPADVLALVRAEPGEPPMAPERQLYRAIWQRHTNRGPYTDQPIPHGVQASMRRAAEFESASLHMLDRARTVDVLAAAAQAGRELAMHPDHQAELRRWVDTGRDDGIPAAALPLQPASSPSPVRADDLLAVAPGVARDSATYERFPRIALLTTAHDEPEDWLIAGQALQRVLLTATLNGLSASFLYQLVELRDMHAEDAPAWPGPRNTQMVIRLGYDAVPAISVPRRPTADISSTARRRNPRSADRKPAATGR